MRARSVVIVDYGMGNIASIANAFGLLGVDCQVASEPAGLAAADALVLPGVGAFAAAMSNLEARGLRRELEIQVMQRKRPFLGICLGMQLLAKDSTEGGLHPGLAWLDAHVVALRPEGGLRIPHVGWNNLDFDPGLGFFRRVEPGAHFYFDHGFQLQCPEDLVVATAEYGGRVVAAIRSENLFATQFHPEKSQRDGLKVLRNFLQALG